MHPYQNHILLLLIILVICSIQVYKFIQEGFNNQISNIVILGDSIYDNEPYVPEEKSVKTYLSKKSLVPIEFLARDNSTMTDTMIQFKHIPKNLNTTSTILVVSMGGNNILNAYQNDDTTDLARFNLIWVLYKEHIRYMKEKSKYTIILTNLYYVTDPLYRKYIPLTKEWNKRIQTFSKQEHLSVFDCSTVLTKSTDFTNGIEPSITGGEKLANSLLAFIHH